MVKGDLVGKIIEAVSLDFGGTLAYEVKENHVMYRDILDELGYDIELGKVEEALKYAIDWWRQEKTRIGILWNEETDAIWFERMLGYLAVPYPHGIAAKMAELWPLRIKYKAFDDAEPTLSKLKGMGLRLIVVSNVPSLRILSLLMGQTGLLPFFDLLVASGSVGFEKPDQRIFKSASQMANVPVERIVHVGNRHEEDYLGARSAGMSSVLIDRTETYGDVQCRKISKLSELPDLLDSES
jgi:putative hydrolase of the HAD superfamily